MRVISNPLRRFGPKRHAVHSPALVEPLEPRKLLAWHDISEFTQWNPTPQMVTESRTFTKTASVPEHAIVKVRFSRGMNATNPAGSDPESFELKAGDKSLVKVDYTRVPQPNQPPVDTRRSNGPA